MICWYPDSFLLLFLCYQQVLVTNEFAVTSQLVGAPHPRAWKDSWRLAPNEVIFLLELGKRFVIGTVWVAFVLVLLHRMKSDVSNRARSRSPKKKAGLDYFCHHV